MPKHVTLTGMMGSGKSTVAPHLAAVLERDYLEIDELVVQQEGLTVAQIFDEKGEAYFRKVERQLILERLSAPPAVLSLGGGAFVWTDTRKFLLQDTTVVYLAAQIDTLLNRLGGKETAKRPLLSIPGVDVRYTITKMMERRHPLYLEAHLTVDTDNLSPAEIVQLILDRRDLFD